MNLALNIFIKFCLLNNPTQCETYLAFSDFSPGYTLEVCEKASREFAIDHLLVETELYKTKFVAKTWCAFNLEEGS